MPAPKKENKLEIISAVKNISIHGGLVRLMCTMNDGSVWSCDNKGQGFVREVPPIDELNECLHQQLKK